MNKKELIKRTINHESVSRVPLMFRGEPALNKKLLKHFSLDNLKDCWEELTDILGADIFSDGETLGAFTTYFPKYIGPYFNALFEINRFNIWGIKPVEAYVGDSKHIIFSQNPPLYDLNEIDDVKNYRYPKLEWFDFNIYKVNVEQIEYDSENQQDEIILKNFKRSDKYFNCTSCNNSIFMTSIYMRGFEKMCMDLVLNQKYAECLISNIGQYMFEFCVKNLNSIGKFLDLYGIWDDIAMQNDLIISPDLWRKYYKPWHKKIINEAKKYDLLICYHICGNCNSVIPDLIEMGVDILDPVQVSAKDMDLDSLKKKYGKYICFNGGLDGQRLIPNGSPDEIKEEVDRIKKLFDYNGGIILGPSHYITKDTPVNNVIAIYK